MRPVKIPGLSEGIESGLPPPGYRPPAQGPVAFYKGTPLCGFGYSSHLSVQSAARVTRLRERLE